MFFLIKYLAGNLRDKYKLRLLILFCKGSLIDHDYLFYLPGNHQFYMMIFLIYKNNNNLNFIETK